MPASSTDAPAAVAPVDLRDHASDVTSQHGENGIIAAIFRAIGTTNRVCVEFGAYDLRKDSCVYPFWAREGWDAVLFEANAERAERIRRDYEARGADERAGSVTIVEGFVRPEGPESLDARLAALGQPVEPDLVVIDVDGVDYQIFRAMERTRPRLVLVEFNPTVPPHVRMVGRDDGNYVGCSALSLHELGKRKGYSLVACTLVNAFFVRDDLEPARHFQHVDDLQTLFDRRGLCYLMSGYDGGVFLSREPFFHDWLFADAPQRGLPAGHGFVFPAELASLRYFASRAGMQALRRRAPRAASLLRKVARGLRLAE